MNLEDVNDIGIRYKARKRVGRGEASGSGKTAGRGAKGQKARSGFSRHVGFEGGQMPMVRRMPKRGFNNFCRKDYVVVNVGDLNRFADGTEVGPDQMKEARLVRGRHDGIKVLGGGELRKKIVVRAHRFSDVAAGKITAAGGTVEAIR